MTENPKDLPRVRMAVEATCPDCGHRLRYIDELDTHDLKCLGPIRLVFTDDAIYGEVWE